ncbi:CRISPR-associated protein Cas4 [bacterium]|nr:MAG: CRISPR-associated protein Cas4 [bacterium]
MYSEDDLVQLSALQHYIFCPRQCALIHLEQLWEENRLTAEGQLMHKRADSGKAETRGNVKKATGLLLRSLALGLSGKADVVEYLREEGGWRPYPVEYKRGRPRPDGADEVQLCAQALCLEEMTGKSIGEGALYYGEKKRRKIVPLTEKLRERTIETALGVHELLKSGKTPAPVKAAHCANCSLNETCLPDLGAKRTRVRDYISRMLREE